MKSDIARQPLAVTVFSALVLAAVPAVAVVRLPHVLPVPCEGPLAVWTEPAFAALPVWARAAAWSLSALACGVSVVRLVNRYSVAVIRVYLPLVFYVAAACGLLVPLAGLPGGGFWSFPSSVAVPGAAAVLVPPLLTAATSLQVESFRRSYRFSAFFRASFYLGMLPLLYSPALPLVLLVPLSALLYGRAPRELAVGAVGAVLPAALAAFGLWAADASVGDAAARLWEPFTASGSPFGRGFVPLVTLALVAASVVIGAAGIAGRWRGLRTRPRKIYRHCFWLLLLGLAGIPFSAAPAAALGILAPALSVILTGQFLRGRGIAGTGAYVLLLAWIIAANLLSH